LELSNKRLRELLQGQNLWNLYFMKAFGTPLLTRHKKQPAWKRDLNSW
jgi:hypothetical protein